LIRADDDEDDDDDVDVGADADVGAGADADGLEDEGVETEVLLGVSIISFCFLASSTYFFISFKGSNCIFRNSCRLSERSGLYRLTKMTIVVVVGVGL